MIGQRANYGDLPPGLGEKQQRNIRGMSKNTVTLLDRLLAIPVAIYFWWYEQMQKLRKTTKKDS